MSYLVIVSKMNVCSCSIIHIEFLVRLYKIGMFGVLLLEFLVSEGADKINLYRI